MVSIRYGEMRRRDVLSGNNMVWQVGLELGNVRYGMVCFQYSNKAFSNLKN